MNKFSAQEIQDGLKKGDWVKAIQFLPTIAHELAHWHDTVGTLWGLQYLDKVFRSYLIQPRLRKSGFENAFHCMMDLHDEERRMRYSRYYTVTDGIARPTPAEGWIVDVSSGLEFDPRGRLDQDRPILFVRLKDGRGGDFSVRQPICVAALLEVTATWTEMKTSEAILNRMENHDRAVHKVFVQKDFLERFQDPEFSLYSAPVHLLKKYCEIKCLHDSYKLSSALVFVCLNLVGSHFQKMNKPNVPGLDPEWDRRFSVMSRKQLVSYAYYCLCTHAQTWTGDFQQWLQETLASANLPPLAEIAKHSEKVIETKSTDSGLNILTTARSYMHTLGRKIIIARSATEGCGLDAFELIKSDTPILPFFDQEGKIVDLGDTCFDLEKFDPNEFFDLEAKMHTQVINFVSGCR